MDGIANCFLAKNALDSGFCI